MIKDPSGTSVVHMAKIIRASMQEVDHCPRYLKPTHTTEYLPGLRVKMNQKQKK